MLTAEALKKPRGGVTESDIQKGTPGQVQCGIAYCLQLKGYCVINDAIERHVAEAAQDDVQTLDEAGSLLPASPLIQKGLFGEDGSDRICDLQMQSPHDDSSPNGQGLKEVDLYMWSVVNGVAGYLQDQGLRTNSRSTATVHQSGTPVDDAELTDDVAVKWLPLFVSRKVMVAIFLGPGHGSLELKPFDDEANPIDITTTPGMCVIIRTDQLSFTHEGPGDEPSNVVTCFMVNESIGMLHRNLMETHMCPAAFELEAWVTERLRAIKSAEREDTVLDESIPRSFVLAMNHQYHTRQQIAVRGFNMRVPSSWDTETFFLGLTSGVDFPIEVPTTRWEHDTVYDADPNSWQQNPPKTNCRHAAFLEGIELFDNKMFGLSPAEVKTMDPGQRFCLEVAYDALFSSGMKKKDLNNSTCAMYVGTSAGEWGYAERTADVGVFGATGGAPSITAGRISFCLGLKGASLAIDTEAASSLTATYYACESVEQKGLGHVHALACGVGTHFILAKAWWPAHSAAGFLSANGRCSTFDASSDGYVRGECTGCIVVRAVVPSGDDEEDDDDEEKKKKEDDNPLFGIIAGGYANNNGRNMNLNAPSGPAEQEVLVEACRRAGITPYDMDALECHGAGNFLGDAVEVKSACRALRGGNTKEMLMISASKAQHGNMIEAAGVCALGKVMYAIKWGVSTPAVHLRQLNPHLEFGDAPVMIPDEMQEFRMHSTFQGVTGRGFGGTNVHLICYGSVDETLRPPPVVPEDLLKRRQLSFWPAGGGSLETGRPRKGYFLSGTFNSWTPEIMTEEGDGCWCLDITLGDNRWEQFHILIDGDERNALHPLNYKSHKGTAVHGPDSTTSRDATWLLDGRTHFQQLKGPAQGSGTELATEPEVVEIKHIDKGSPGDKYRISFYMSGKWRTVSWVKLDDRAATGTSTAIVVGSSASRYFLTGTWNNWTFQEMDAGAASTYSAEVRITRPNCEFQIMRNEDRRQAIFPMGQHGTQSTGVAGPDDSVWGMNWALPGQPGDVFRVEFMREDEKCSVKWEKVRTETLSEAEVTLAALPRISAVGTWDQFGSSVGLRYDAKEAVHTFYLRLGAKGREGFILLADDDIELVICPNIPNAHPGVPHTVQGPGPRAYADCAWTIGADDEEGVKAFGLFEVRLHMRPDGAPLRVSWEQLKSLPDGIEAGGHFKAGK